MGIYPLLSLLTIISKFPTLSKSQRTKRKINAFSIFGIFYTTHHHNEGRFPRCVFRHIIGVKDVAKIIKNYKSNNFYKEKNTIREQQRLFMPLQASILYGEIAGQSVKAMKMTNNHITILRKPQNPSGRQYQTLENINT